MIAEEYLKDIKRKVDTLVLGCTHYPLLSETIRKVMGDEVAQVSSAEELALALKALIDEKQLGAAQRLPVTRIIPVTALKSLRNWEN